MFKKALNMAVTGLILFGGGLYAQETQKVVTVTQPAKKPQTVCPVLGGAIDKTVYADYQGKRVYFCCAGCIDVFKKDPAKYLKKAESGGVTLDATPAPSPAKAKP